MPGRIYLFIYLISNILYSLHLHEELTI